MQFVRQHRVLLMRLLCILGAVLAVWALVTAFVFDALHLALIRAGQYQSISRLYVAQGIIGGLIVGLTAAAWKQRTKVEGDGKTTQKA
jgi:hypothetical protein